MSLKNLFPKFIITIYCDTYSNIFNNGAALNQTLKIPISITLNNLFPIDNKKNNYFQGEYTVTNCDCFQCGDQCLEPMEIPLYMTCNGICQSVDLTCNGTCQLGSMPCGDICLSPEMQETFSECNGAYYVK